jgi:hypothetical protein
VDIRVLEEYYSSEWACFFSSLEIPKKNGTIRVVTDFRKLNLMLKRHPYDPFNGRVYICFSIGL